MNKVSIGADIDYAYAKQTNSDFIRLTVTVIDAFEEK